MKLFGRSKRSRNPIVRSIRTIGVLSLFAKVVGKGLLSGKGNRKQFKKFLKKEIHEVQDFLDGDQNAKKTKRDMRSHLHDFFIPHDGNGHRPKSLQRKSLLTYVVLALLFKAGLTAGLFFAYPNPAHLSAIVSQNILQLVNESRASSGVPLINLDSTLTAFAHDKAYDMVGRDYFSHDTPEGKRPWEWIERKAYDYVFAGENLAMGFSEAELVHEAFMASPTHRKNILNPRYQDIGLAIVNGTIAGKDTTLLVQFFGTKRTALAAAVPPPAPVPSEAPEPPAQPPTGEGVPVASDEATAVETPTVPTPDPQAAPAAPAADVPAEEVVTAGSENLTSEPFIFSGRKSSGRTLLEFTLQYADIVFYALLLFVAAAFLINVFVHVRVQHAGMIAQALVVMALITSTYLVKFHFLERTATTLVIN